MSRLVVRHSGPLRGRVRVPGDKSISHRALLLGGLAGGASQVRRFLSCGDCSATLACLCTLGVRVEVHNAGVLTVHGCGLHGLRAPETPLNCVRSGTTMRLLAGILAGQPFTSVLTGEQQLLSRPMRRVVEPLHHMGAAIEDTGGRAPLTIHGGRLRGADHTLSVASAQVKSALLLAGLYADGPTTVRQCGPARDHTERMLASMGVDVAVNGLDVTLSPPASLAPLALCVPGDMSAAAFLLVAAALVPGSRVTVEDVGVNATRTGLLDVLQGMGARIAIEGRRTSTGLQGDEPLADLTVRASDLRGVQVCGQVVVRMIDELPVLAVAATQAHGTTVVRDAAELRVKESDRIATIVTELRALGAHIEPLPDGFLVEGPTRLCGTAVDSHGDHRLAMALAIAGLVAEGETAVQNAQCIADSFPDFESVLNALVSRDA